MLTREDLTPLKDKGGYLDAARKRRAGSASDGGTASVSQTVRGTVSTDTGYVGGYESEGPGTSQSIYGGDGGEEGGTREPDGFNQQFRRNSFKSPGRDSSIYQPERPASTTFWSGVKNTAKLYGDALKSSPKKTRTTSTIKKPTSRTLTDLEAIKLKPKLLDLIAWQSEHMDEFISATTKGHEPVEIWSTLDNDDMEIIADFLISQARVNVGAAVAVRYAAGVMDKIKLGMIIGPRVYSTMITYFERGFSIGPIFQRRY